MTDIRKDYSDEPGMHGDPRAKAARDFASGLRAVADWIEAHPEVGLPDATIKNYSMNDKAEAEAVARALGTFRKVYSDWSFTMVKQFGPIEMSFVFMRETVCERRVVGTKRVAEEIVPAREGRIIPAHDAEVVEWVCGAVLDKGEG